MARKEWAALAWLAVWGFWVVVSRNNHPTLLLNVIATALLVLSFAAAVVFNGRVLVPRYLRPRKFAAYGATLLIAMSLLTVLVVVLIQAAYDVLWGPDPRRFGFGVNFGLDFFGMAVHLIGASGLLWLLRRRAKYTD